jgi:hypothetical protein
MQKGNALHPFRLAAALRRRTRRLVPVGLVPVGLRKADITTGTMATARAFRPRRGFMRPGGMHARRGPSASV